MAADPYVCPECGKPGGWRSGVGFEHQMICMRSENHKNPKRSVVWCPDDIGDENLRRARDGIGRDGDGI